MFHSEPNHPVIALPPAGPVDLILHSSFDDISDTWKTLESLPCLSLHQSLSWCQSWAQTHRNPVVLVEGRLSGTCVFILPLEIKSAWYGKMARFIGAPFSNINTGLFSEAFLHYANPALMAEISDKLCQMLKGRADFIVLSRLPTLWRGVFNPLMHLPSIRNQNPAFQLPLLSSMDATLAQINAKARRKKFRRTEKRIDAQGGYEHLIIRNPDEKHACLDLFFKQKSVRFETIKLPNIFERDETKAFFHALLDLPDDPHNTALELHALRLNTSGTIVAIAGVSFKNDHIICQFSSIDETKAEDISPGEFLFHLVIETMQKRGFALFDFGIGDQRYKRSWCPVVTEHRDVVIPVTVRGHMASLIIRAIVRIKMMIKNNSAIYALVQRMRLKLSRP